MAYNWLMHYNWQLQDWPNFTFEASKIEPLLWTYVEKAARFKGLLDALDHSQLHETELELLTREAITSSKIEGEIFSREQVMSSIQNHLGGSTAKTYIHDHRTEGLGQMMGSLRNQWSIPICEEEILTWHRMLMQGYHHLTLGEWRSGPEPMHIVSGILGDETIHFEAPPACDVPKEMEQFFGWLDSLKISFHQSPINAAVAHLYFESIHPFEDGNGRIGRALSEKILMQGLGTGKMFGISTALEAHRQEYYAALKRAQRSNEVTEWVRWFCGETLQAIDRAEQVILFVLAKSKILHVVEREANSRQQKCVNRMLQQGPQGFSGGMTAKKYQAITKASKATATRDLGDLVTLGILKGIGEGRSTHYELRLWPEPE